MKTTVRGMLFKISNKNKELLDDMMIKFSSAMRYAFNRREHKPLKELEPELMQKYAIK